VNLPCVVNSALPQDTFCWAERPRRKLFWRRELSLPLKAESRCSRMRLRLKLAQSPMSRSRPVTCRPGAAQPAILV
jgi:hypothetical protein